MGFYKLCCRDSSSSVVTVVEGCQPKEPPVLGPDRLPCRAVCLPWPLAGSHWPVLRVPEADECGPQGGRAPGWEGPTQWDRRLSLLQGGLEVCVNVFSWLSHVCF